MRCAIWHPRLGWFCTSDFGGYAFSESMPDIVYWFDSVQDARHYFGKHPDRKLLEIYYSFENQGKELFEN